MKYKIGDIVKCIDNYPHKNLNINDVGIVIDSTKVLVMVRYFKGMTYIHFSKQVQLITKEKTNETK